MRTAVLPVVCLLLGALVSRGSNAAVAPDSVQVVSDQLVADRVTGAFVATGHVRAVVRPMTIVSESISRDAEGNFTFADPTAVTTCSNAFEHLHWKLAGEVTYRDRQAVMVRNAWLSLYGCPVFWLPFWYYPMDTDYGFHCLPGYTSRWGAYLMTEYVYGLYRSEDGRVSLRGRTRLDVRQENGMAAGQDLDWRLRDLGEGAFRVYYAWDDDYGRYKRHAQTRKWRYQNWESEVDHERYRLEFLHRCDLTERDAAWADLNYASDSAFKRDFLRRGALTYDPRFRGGRNSRVGWEHAESLFGLALLAEMPFNDFDGGVSRLPELVVSVNPLKLPWIPVNYESQTRVGYLRRNAGEIGTDATALPFRYRPGRWADYDAFRADTYHRLTLPMKFADLLSVVPRVGYHGTFWDDAGNTVLDGRGKAGSDGDNIYRSIFEGGVTFSARGAGVFDRGWRHIVEPYLDVLAQEADFSGLGRAQRPYVFDGVDGSFGWSDQFAGRSRNLPYSYYGVTPGLRNTLKRVDERGNIRTILDFDIYGAFQFNDTDYTAGDRYHRLSRDPADPNYGDQHGMIIPGARLLWHPAVDWTLGARAEYDPEENTLAESQLLLRQKVDSRFSWTVNYRARDHRRWDYSSAVYDPAVQRDESFNWARYQLLDLSCEYELCDQIAMGPYLEWDFREGEFDEVGAWIDYRTDCLGFRLILSHEFEYDRIDYSTRDDDTRVEFLIYLRAFGPDFGTPVKL